LPCRPWHSTYSSATRAVAHRYVDVDRILGARNYREVPGAAHPKPDYNIDFKEGGAWVLVGWEPRDRAIIEYAARRSHKAIRWVAEID